MAISRNKKQTLVAELTELLQDAKMTVFAKYQGATVAQLQNLRRDAREAGLTVKVVKNRLVQVAAQNVDKLKDADLSGLKGQLVYVMSSEDEVAPAQVLDGFIKENPLVEFVGGLSGEGELLSVKEVQELAGLPSKNELIAQTVAQLLSPVHDVTNALSGNLHALLDGVEAKATN